MFTRHVVVTIVLVNVVSTMSFVSGETTFERSENLCSDRCNCIFSADKKMSKIDCSDSKMHHTIASWPELASSSSNIIALFKDNNITTLERMPGTYASLKLVFSNCQIKYLDTGLFEATVNVKYVDLSHNLLENDQLGGDVFKGPYNVTDFRPIGLEYLSLAYNLLHSLQKDMFEHVPNLKVLNLEGNRFRVLDHVTTFAFSNIPNLQTLNLANNQLTEIPIDVMKNLRRNLTELNIALNDLDFVPTSLSYVYETLQVLNISGNPMESLEFYFHFEGLKKLLKLYANNLTELAAVGANALAYLQSLEVLELSRNPKLFEINAYAFVNTKKIIELHLEGNALLHIPSGLLPWSELRVLNMKGNRLYCDCDLYNISQLLQDEIKRNRDGPYCLDAKAFTTREVYTLKDNACEMWSPFNDGSPSKSALHKSMTLMRTILTLMMILLVVSTAFALWLAVMKWKTYRRSLNYPFPNLVVYNPVSTYDSPRY